jgi:hypothetical protein
MSDGTITAVENRDQPAAPQNRRVERGKIRRGRRRPNGELRIVRA